MNNKKNLNNAEKQQLNIGGVSGSSSQHIEYAKKSGEKLDEMGKIFNKTKDGRPCYFSELSYHETNDL